MIANTPRAPIFRQQAARLWRSSTGTSNIMTQPLDDLPELHSTEREAQLMELRFAGWEVHAEFAGAVPRIYGNHSDMYRGFNPKFGIRFGTCEPTEAAAWGKIIQYVVRLKMQRMRAADDARKGIKQVKF